MPNEVGRFEMFRVDDKEYLEVTKVTQRDNKMSTLQEIVKFLNP